MSVKWSAVDFQNRLIKVCRSYCGVLKEIRETTKSRKIRHVPLGEGIFHDLSKAYEGRAGTELVFHLNGEMLDKSNLRNRHFNRDIKGSGVPKIRIHDMRHTFASHFMMNGGNLYALQAILGHSDTKMTQRYAHLSKTYFTEKADIVRFGDLSEICRKQDDGNAGLS